jgi:clan AA aspartic protease
MGFVRVTGRIGFRDEDAQEIEFLVDSGSYYTLLPPQLFRQTGITQTVTTPVLTADSRRVDVPVGVAALGLLGREAAVLVGQLEVPMPLLGTSALEALGLMVDPVNERVIPSRAFGPAAFRS